MTGHVCGCAARRGTGTDDWKKGDGVLNIDGSCQSSNFIDEKMLKGLYHTTGLPKLCRIRDGDLNVVMGVARWKFIDRLIDI